VLADTYLPGVDIPLPDEPPDEWQPPGDGPQHDYGLGGAVAYRKQRLRIEREARRQLDAEERPRPAIPPIRPLSALLAEPDEATAYCIDGLMPTDSRILVAAQWKAGKSTLAANVIRSLVDGTPFLGRFDVLQRADRLVLVDDELSEAMLRRWLREQNIDNEAAVADVVSLRGKVGAFDLLDHDTRRQWVDRLRGLGCDYLILDCLRPVLDALGLDENHDAGRFLDAFDRLLSEAGVPAAMVVQHMGHSGERSRGDSRLQDWPDAVWRLVRESDDPASPRFFSAYGRDVDVPEGRLAYDPATRRLSYSDGSRANIRAEAALVAVVELLAGHAMTGDKGDDGRAVGLGVNAIEDALGSQHSRKAIREGVAAALHSGAAEWHRGPRKAKLHRLKYPCADCGRPVSSGAARHESCAEQGAH
jgi:hypothetical protein